MNIFKHEFRASLRSVITWSAALIAVILIFESLFTSFASQAEQINQLMANYPPQLLAAFGLNGADLSSVLGFFSFIFVFVQLCTAIQASIYGFALVSVEEREWTADFLLTRPLTRTRILTSKLLAALSGLLITDLALWAASFASVAAFSGGKAYDAGILALLMASIIAFQLFFFAVGLALSLLVKRIRNVMPYALGLSFGMYVLSAFSGYLGASVLEKITPFKHFEASYAVQNGGFNPALAFISLGVTLVSIAASYVLYRRRDIAGVS